MRKMSSLMGQPGEKNAADLAQTDQRLQQVRGKIADIMMAEGQRDKG